MTERWAPIPGFEGLYEVSDHGRLRGLDRTLTDRLGRPYSKPGRSLDPVRNRSGRP